MIPSLPARAVPDDLVAAFIDALNEAGLRGEAHAQIGDRVVLATDNSIYQRQPAAVVYPRDAEDVSLVARLLGDDRFRAVRIAPRGGGTGTNGQSLTDGVVVDLSRHMNAIVEIDIAARRVRVQAGVVKDQLNAALAPHGLFFAPELSTANRATIGGMISTDACGQGSCLYGKTSNHVLSLRTALIGGDLWESHPLEPAELATVIERQDRIGQIHGHADRLARERADDIARVFPPLNRSLTGYDLAHLRDEQGRFNLNSLICGAEGTLGIVVEATLNVLPIPRHTALVLIGYDSFDAALRDARKLALAGAASVETIDDMVLRLARSDQGWGAIAAHMPADGERPVAGLNVVEFVGDEPGGVRSRVGELLDDMERQEAGWRTATSVDDPAMIGAIWQMRKKAVGLLGNLAGERRPIPFVEDTAVPPENLADFIAEYRALLDRRQLSYGMFGHADAGVLHVRPALDMKDPADAASIRQITDEVAELTRKYGGLLWGEHGKGFRSEYGPAYFGALYPAMQAIKALFDPHDQLNPGKIASPGGALTPIDAVPFKGQYDSDIPEEARLSFGTALHCNGNGACYNYDPDDPMCPSWKATRERRHSPKGRAQLMREWLRRLAEEGVDPLAAAREERQRSIFAGLTRRFRRRDGAADDFSHTVKEAMDGCLGCKACAGQCPIKVDIPTLRSRFLELYHTRYPRPVRDHLLSRLETFLPYAAKAPRLYNLAAKSAVGRSIGDALGLTALPSMGRGRLAARAARLGCPLATPSALDRLDEEERTRAVIIVQDVFTSSFDETVVLDIIELLVQLGLRPFLAPMRANGKPLHVQGFQGRFQRTAARNAADLAALARTGVPLVGIDPSMTLTYRSEYRTALGADAPSVLLLQEWLANVLPGLPPGESRQDVLLFPHCSESATAPDAVALWRPVLDKLGMKATTVKVGCCGMAGTFGHETRNRATSEAVFDLSWRAKLDATDAPLQVATGFSCRHQATLMTGRTLLHPLQAALKHLQQKNDNHVA